MCFGPVIVRPEHRRAFSILFLHKIISVIDFPFSSFFLYVGIVGLWPSD